MTTQQILNSLYSSDGSKYGNLTNGGGSLGSTVTALTGYSKQLSGIIAPDGSMYFTLTDGNGNLV